MIKQILFGGTGGGSRFVDLGLTLFRVGLGLFLAFGHGVSKLPPEGVKKFAGYLQSLHVPAPTASAWAAMFAEFVCGLLLAIGLFTRPAALLIVITMLVAVSTAHFSDPLFGKPPSKELALLYLMGAALFLFTGAGRYGVDAALRRRGATGRYASDRR